MSSTSPRAPSASAAMLFGIIATAGLQSTRVDAHVYMMAPVARNLWGTSAFQEPGSPNMNFCPHCFQSRGPGAIRARSGGAPWPHLNGERASNGNYIESDAVSERHGICGDPEQTAAEGSNLYGMDNSNYPVLETYDEGGVFEVKIVLSTWHWGHVEMFVCNADDLPDGPDGTVTQSCFNKYPLDRVETDGDGPIDPSFPGRMILDPPCRAKETDQTMVEGATPGDVAIAHYRLPSGLSCERCVVQMIYYTGNSCKHEGYAEFNPPSWPGTCATTKADWINEVVGFCGVGDAYPEEFWNCADIQIVGGGTPEAPTPSIPTAPEATPAPMSTMPDSTPAPVDGATPSPMMDPAIPSEECTDPVAGYEQCGGTSYTGSTCCVAGYQCTEMAECFSECRPGSASNPPMEGTVTPTEAPATVDTDDGNSAPTGIACNEHWYQCDGMGWDGPTCCNAGAECVKLDDYFYQCVPN